LARGGKFQPGKFRLSENIIELHRMEGVTKKGSSQEKKKWEGKLMGKSYASRGCAYKRNPKQGMVLTTPVVWEGEGERGLTKERGTGRA